jgi:hypothetical protein
MRFFRRGFDPGVRNERGCVDFPRMKEGRLDAEFFAIFLGQGPRTPEAYEKEHSQDPRDIRLNLCKLTRNATRRPE